MSMFGFNSKKKTLSELQEENEQLQEENKNADLVLSIEQKKIAQQKLKENGLKTSNFGSVRQLWNWVKSH
jgi:hypothetical protein